VRSIARLAGMIGRMTDALNDEHESAHRKLMRWRRALLMSVASLEGKPSPIPPVSSCSRATTVANDSLRQGPV
jgi:hypothetical protein